MRTVDGHEVAAAAGLSDARRHELMDWWRRWRTEGEDPKDLEDALRMIVREEIDDPQQVEAEVARVVEAPRGMDEKRERKS